MGIDFEKLKEYLESEEGRKETKDFFWKWNYDSELGAERIYRMINHLSDEDLEKWMDKFVEWEKKYEEMWYKRGVETSSLFFNSLYGFIRKNGVDVSDRYSDDYLFLSASDEWRGYTFKLYQGQGCFYKIEKNNKQIF